MLRTLINRYPEQMCFGLRLISALGLRNLRKIRGKENRVINAGAYLKDCCIEIIGSGNTVKIGRFCRLFHTKITIIGNNNVVELGEYVYSNGGDFYMEDDDGNIQVGEHTTFAGKVHLACIEGSTLTVGRQCLFSSDVIVRVGDSHCLTDLQGNRLNPSRDVHVCDHVWVGARAMILKGVKIHQDCVVGTGAVVTKGTVSPNCALAGNPAKVIKTDINWQNDRI